MVSYVKGDVEEDGEIDTDDGDESEYDSYETATEDNSESSEYVNEIMEDGDRSNINGRVKRNSDEQQIKTKRLPSAPGTAKLKFDLELELSNPNFGQTFSCCLQKQFKERRMPRMKLLEKVKPFPSTLLMARFARMAYQDYEENEKEDEYKKRLDLPEGWTLLTTANKGKYWKFLTGKTNNYFGIALWNKESEQVVISHRGTRKTNIDAVKTDIKGIWKNKYTGQMNSACTFTHKIYREFRQSHFRNVQIFITGHSLGGWLAQIASFALKYLTVVGEKQKTKFCLLEQKDDDRPLPHTVVFESPGCSPMLTKMAKDFDCYQKKTIGIDHLHIRTYFSAPNKINSINNHVGTLFQIDTVRKSHAISVIIDALEKERGIIGMNNWPLVDPESTWRKIFKGWSSALDEKENCELVSNFSEDYADNGGLSQLFNKKEAEFVVKFLQLMADERFNPNFLFTNITKTNLNFLTNEIKKIKIENEVVSSKDEKTSIWYLIPFLKRLLYGFPELKNKVEFASTPAGRIFAFPNNRETIHSLALKFGTSQIHNELRSFLEENQKTFWLIEAPGNTDIVTSQLYGKLKELDAYYPCVELHTALEMNLQVADVLKATAENIFIVQCQKCGNSELNYENYILNLLRMLDKKLKIILVVDKNENTRYQKIKDYATFNYCKAKLTEWNGVKWDDFTLEVKNYLLSKQLISYQGFHKHMSLNKLGIGDFNRLNDILDSRTLVKLMNDEEIAVGNHLLGLEDPYIPRKLQQYNEINEAINEPFHEDQFLRKNVEQQLKVIITGKSGTGKKTFLTSLASKIKAKFPTAFLIRVNLIKCSDALEDLRNLDANCDCPLNNPEGAVSFLIDRILEDTIKTTFEKELLKLALSDEIKSVLLVDGIDKICPTYENVTLRWLQALAKSKLDNIIVTTRPYAKRQVDNHLKALSYGTLPFTPEDQTDFLIKYWQKTRDRSEDYLKCLATKLSKTISKKFKDPENTFMEVPYHVKLIGQYSENKIDNANENIFFSMVHFLESLVSETFTKHCSQRSTSDRNLEIDLKTKHWQCASRALLSEDVHKQLFPNTSDMEAKLKEKDLNEEMMKLGVVEAIDGGVPQFVHSIYGQYFVFDYFSNLLKYAEEVKDEDGFFLADIKINTLFGEILLNRNLETTRTLLNNHLEISPDDSRIRRLMKWYVGIIQKSWTTEDWKLRNAYDETALHVLTDEKQENILLVLNRCIEEADISNVMNYYLNAIDRDENTYMDVAKSRYLPGEIVKLENRLKSKKVTGKELAMITLVLTVVVTAFVILHNEKENDNK